MHPHRLDIDRLHDLLLHNATYSPAAVRALCTERGPPALSARAGSGLSGPGGPHGMRCDRGCRLRYSQLGSLDRSAAAAAIADLGVVCTTSKLRRDGEVPRVTLGAASHAPHESAWNPLGVGEVGRKERRAHAGDNRAARVGCGAVPLL
jgi:hypothetical protein